MEDVVGRHRQAALRSSPRRPIRRLKSLVQLNSSKFAAYIAQAVAVGVGARQFRSGSCAVNGRAFDAEMQPQKHEIEPRVMEIFMMRGSASSFSNSAHCTSCGPVARYARGGRRRKPARDRAGRARGEGPWVSVSTAMLSPNFNPAGRSFLCSVKVMGTENAPAYAANQGFLRPLDLSLCQKR